MSVYAFYLVYTVRPYADIDSGFFGPVAIAKENSETNNELNVLVVGMPNVGKSTLLNSLRGAGVSGKSFIPSYICRNYY